MSCQWDSSAGRCAGQASSGAHCRPGRRRPGRRLPEIYRVRTMIWRNCSAWRLDGGGSKVTLLTSQSLNHDVPLQTHPCSPRRSTGQTRAAQGSATRRAARCRARPVRRKRLCRDPGRRSGRARRGLQGHAVPLFPKQGRPVQSRGPRNISGRFQEMEPGIRAIRGRTPDMLRYCMKMWWGRRFDQEGARRAARRPRQAGCGGRRGVATTPSRRTSTRPSWTPSRALTSSRSPQARPCAS